MVSLGPESSWSLSVAVSGESALTERRMSPVTSSARTASTVILRDPPEAPIAPDGDAATSA